MKAHKEILEEIRKSKFKEFSMETCVEKALQIRDKEIRKNKTTNSRTMISFHFSSLNKFFFSDAGKRLIIVFKSS